MSVNHPKLDLSSPKLMAIVNATPDSFSDGGLLYHGRKLDQNKVKARLQLLVDEGADILDIGGESTRPGASPVSEQEELDRVMPIVELAVQETDLAVSVDTSTPRLMLEAASAGAHIINDVRALAREGALEAAASSSLFVCLMHMQGTPTNMQDNPTYDQVNNDVANFLKQRIDMSQQAGIAPEKIWIDPGFGFGKTLQHNLMLLAQLPMIEQLGFPVLVGLSRKSLIGHLLGRDLEERLPASLALAMMSLERGAKILRVHDIQATRDAIDVFCAVSDHDQ